MNPRHGLGGPRRFWTADTLCPRCFVEAFGASPARSLQRSSIHTRRKLHAVVAPDRPVNSQTFIHKYFSANSSLDRGWTKNVRLLRIQSEAMSSTQAAGQSPTLSQLPVKTGLSDAPSKDGNAIAETSRKRRRKHGDIADPIIPPDASSQLTTTATSLPTSAAFRRKSAAFLSLSKPRLSFLMTLTTTTAYALYPVPDILSPSAIDLSTTTLTFLWITLGTYLSSSCANTLNMTFEPHHDAQMSRTRNRPIVRGLVTPRAAYIFAFVTGASGLTLLYFGTNPTVAALSAMNIFLYAGVYTPMKRLSVANTWVGAIVGAIPPLMGWVAGAGQAATMEHHAWQDLLLTSDSAGGWLLAALLFAWQFPHFNALSHTIREEYRNAGYRMLAWVNPAANARVALRYSFALFPICAGLWWTGVVNPGFLMISGVCNVWMTREAVRFWKRGGAGGSARGLFWASIWHLPLVMVGAVICKTGLWDGFLGNVGDEEPEPLPLIQSEQPVDAVADARLSQSAAS